MAASDMKSMSDEQVQALLRQRESELSALKAKQAKAATAKAEAAAPAAVAQEKRAASFWYPAKRPPLGAWLLPLLFLWGQRRSMSEESFAMALGLFAIIIYVGHCTVEWFERSEWRQQLRKDADAASEPSKKEKSAPKTKSAGPGSSKKRSQKVD